MEPGKPRRFSSGAWSSTPSAGLPRGYRDPCSSQCRAAASLTRQTPPPQGWAGHSEPCSGKQSLQSATVCKLRPLPVWHRVGEHLPEGLLPQRRSPHTSSWGLAAKPSLVQLEEAAGQCSRKTMVFLFPLALQILSFFSVR